MKKLIMSLCILVVSNGIFNISAHADSSEDDPILTGKTARADLQKQPYSKWFTKNYEAYKADDKTIAELKKISQNIKITIIMGTWCPDSQKEVPRAFKIFDGANIDDQNVTIITVHKFAQRDPEIIKKYNITGVPIIILSKENKELGRIIESPDQTLEKDMVKILSPDTKTTE
jgi:thiol-disulfide isomerase/thioredoxin